MSMEDPTFSARLREVFDRQGFMRLIGAEVVAIEPGKVSIRVAFRPDLDQHHGLFHGGVAGAIADNACGAAAATLMPADRVPVTAEYKINLLAPARGDALIARARVLKPGRSLTVCTADVFVERDGVEELCAVALATMVGVMLPAAKE